MSSFKYISSTLLRIQDCNEYLLGKDKRQQTVSLSLRTPIVCLSHVLSCVGSLSRKAIFSLPSFVPALWNGFQGRRNRTNGLEKERGKQGVRAACSVLLARAAAASERIIGRAGQDGTHLTLYCQRVHNCPSEVA